MARPQKSGLDYFPLDTDIDEDDKVALIEAKYGIEGFGVIIKLYKKIYKQNGYYYAWNEETQLLFSRKIGVDVLRIINIIKDAIKWELFDAGLLKKYGILTSKRIQKTYLKITYERKEVEIIKEYILNGVNDTTNRDNLTIKSIKLTNSTQRKGKERKGKEIKEKNIYAEFVKLTEKEYEKLIEKYGEEDTKKMVTILNNYKGSKGKTYKSDYLAILSWVVDKVIKKNKEDWRTT